MLVKLTGISGYPCAVESDDVRAIEPLFEKVSEDGQPEGEPIGAAVHTNCHGVTGIFHVSESVADVLDVLSGPPGSLSGFRRAQQALIADALGAKP